MRLSSAFVYVFGSLLTGYAEGENEIIVATVAWDSEILSCVKFVNSVLCYFTHKPSKRMSV